MDLASLSNPLVSLDQLSSSSSQLDGLSPELENSVRFGGVQLTQAAGVLLRLPQEIIAQAVVIFTRFYTGPEGGSFLLNPVKVNLRLLSSSSRHSPCLFLGCIGRIIVHDRQNLIPTSDAPIDFKRLRISIIECAYHVERGGCIFS